VSIKNAMNWRHPLTWIAIALNVLLLFGGWKLLNQELASCRAIDRGISQAQAKVEARRQEVEAEAASLRATRQQLESRLAAWRQELAPLKNDPVLASGARSEEGRIDFKVALFETRHRLRERAEKNELWIPDDIGLSNTIAKGEDTETRLWQLATVAHLIDGALSVELPSIDYLKPLASTNALAGQRLEYYEYPVELSVLCSYRDWLNLHQHFATERPYLALRRLSVEVDRPFPSTMLSVQAVYGGSRLAEPSSGEASGGPDDKVENRPPGPPPLLLQPLVGGGAP